jgi:hypothetical protein
MRNRLSPQQKKKNSYAKDRRNAYGERGANSRFAIRENKINAERSRRKAENQVLQTVLPPRDEEVFADIDNRLKSQPARHKHFHKFADAPLGTVIARKLTRRQAHREVAAEREPADPARTIERASRSAWHLDAADVLAGWTAGGSGGRTNYKIELTLSHAPTQIAVRGETANSNFTRSRAAAARRMLYRELFLQLEQLVMKHLRLPGRIQR